MNPSSICPRFEKAMSLLSQRWTGLIIYCLLDRGAQRFSEIEASISISGKVLSERLKDLEANGLINRMVYPETPVRIEYSLTDKGHALMPVLQDIQTWAEEWIREEEVNNH